MSPRPPRALPPHPAMRQARTNLLVGAAIALAGALLLASGGGWVSGPIFLTVGGALLGLGLLIRRSAPAAQAVNTALNLASAGQSAEAEERLARADAQFSLVYIRCTIAVNRAFIALRRGDLERTVAFAGDAITRPLGWISRTNQRAHIVEARGARTLALASLGENAGAEADIAAILSSPLASPSALARAELARALLLERAGDRGALGAHLAKNRHLLLEYTHPRERAIVRAFERMLEAQTSSIYRHGAAREPAPRDEPALADWIARLAPSAAVFLRAESTLGRISREGEPPVRAAPPVVPGASAVTKAPSAPARRAGRGFAVLVGWTAILMVFVAITQLLSAQRPPPGGLHPPAIPHDDPSLFAFLLPWLFPAALVALIVFLIRRSRPREEQLLAAYAVLARGDEATALTMFTALSRGLLGTAVPALLALAAEQERVGDLQVAETLCDTGIAYGLRIHAMTSDTVLPALFAERAVILAAQGKSADAATKLAQLEERYPTYALLDTARFRVSLVDRARRGDLAGAAQIAAGRADLPLTVRDELLADLVRVVAGTGAGAGGEVDRLRRELRGDPVSRAWIEKVAPAVLIAFEQDGSEMRARESAGTEEEAERELLAEEEAESVSRAGIAG